MVDQIVDFINGQWTDAQAANRLNIINPALAKPIAEVVLTPQEIVAQAVEAAHKAYLEWRRVPVGERVQPLYKLKALLEANIEDIARTITNECGKTYGEAIAEMRRGIENVEVAAGMPSLIQGYNNEDIASGID